MNSNFNCYNEFLANCLLFDGEVCVTHLLRAEGLCGGVELRLEFGRGVDSDRGAGAGAAVQGKVDPAVLELVLISAPVSN